MKNYLLLATKTKNAVIILIIVGIFTYGNALFNPFISDDNLQIVQNIFVHSITNLPKFFTGGTFYMGGDTLLGNYYTPLMTTAFSFIYTLFGPTPFFFHLFQIGLHITNSILLFFLFKRFFNKYVGLGLSLIFLVHPINVEAVSYIAALQHVLFAFFGLLALQILIAKRDSLKKVTVVSILIFCSLLSKEIGILFVPIILLYIFLFNKKKLLLYTVSIGIMLFLYALLRFSAFGNMLNPHPFAPIMYLPLDERLMHIPLLFVSYLKVFFFPNELSYLQMWTINEVTLFNFYLPLLLILVMGGIAIAAGYYLYKKAHEAFMSYLFFGLWFLLSISIFMQIVPLDSTFGERWFYLPMMGLLGLFGLLITKVKLHNETVRNSLLIIFVIILVALSFRTMNRNADWSDSVKLYSHDLSVQPDNYVIHGAYGKALQMNNRFDEAEMHLNKALTLTPSYIPENFAYRRDLCLNYALRGQKTNNKQDMDKSIICFKEALDKKFNPGLSLQLVKVLYNQKEFKEAEYYAELTIKDGPKNEEAYLLLAGVKYELGKLDEALEAAKQSYMIRKTKQAASWYQKILQAKELQNSKGNQ